LLPVTAATMRRPFESVPPGPIKAYGNLFIQTNARSSSRLVSSKLTKCQRHTPVGGRVPLTGLN
jgi:hypothetical protein